MEDGRNGGRLILISGATGQQGERWRGASSGAGSGYVRSPEIPRSPRRKSSSIWGPRSQAGTSRTARPSSGCSMASTGCSPSSSPGRPASRVKSGRVFCSLTPRRLLASTTTSTARPAAAHSETGIPHFESKWEVEEHVRGSGVPYTVLRPVFFMQNWEFMGEPILGGTLPQPLDPDKPFQMVDANDIGVFATMAFENPGEWIGREVDLAGDEMTMPQIADTFSRVIGCQVDYFQVPWDQFEEQMGEEYALMYRWFDEHGYEADIAALKEEHPGLVTFEQYLRANGWENAGSSPEG